MGHVSELVRLVAAHEVVADRLRRSIALGEVVPGERLPAERTLAANLRVSRLTVREALRLLQDEGALVTRRGPAGGAFVTERSRGLEPAHVVEVFEYRLAVETVAAQLAAERRTEEDLARLAACGRALRESADAGAFRRADSAFHLAIADASGNRMLRRSIEDARAATFDSFDAHPFRVLRDTTARGHDAIAHGIESGDGTAASAAMTVHLRRAQAEVLAVLRGGD
jgi:GntR family transcriptional regulator, transcriptional repressor for pyruvate dehydrogenase complex